MMLDRMQQLAGHGVVPPLHYDALVHDEVIQELDLGLPLLRPIRRPQVRVGTSGLAEPTPVAPGLTVAGPRQVGGAICLEPDPKGPSRGGAAVLSQSRGPCPVSLRTRTAGEERLHRGFSYTPSYLDPTI